MTDIPDKCECDNTHEQNETVCRYCWNRYQKFAIEKYTRLLNNGDIDFDDYPDLAISDDGVYVKAWVWVSKQDIEEDF